MIDHWAAIERKDIIPYYVDECHVLGDTAVGYGWAPSDHVVAVPVAQPHARVSYFGALNMMDGSCVLAAYPTANGDTTVAFLHTLRAKHPKNQLLILWDNARYHYKGDVPAFLDDVNMFRNPDEWAVTCKRFAPRDPKQNPIEHVWHIGKQSIRRCFRKMNTFDAICKKFEEIRENHYYLSNLRMYIPEYLSNSQSI